MDVSKEQVLKMWQDGTLPTLFEGMEAGDKVRFSTEVERILGMASTFYLGKYILGYDKGGDFHKYDMCQWFDDHFYDNTLTLAPRGHYKTSYPNITGCIRHSLIDPNVEIAILVAVGDLASKMLMELKSHHLYNEKFRDLFPAHATRRSKDEGTQVKFTTPARTNRALRQPTFSGLSISQGIVSSHFTLFVYDDIVDKDNSSSPDLRKKVWDSYSLTLPMIKGLNRSGLPWQRFFGTRWHYDDVYSKIIENNEDDEYFKIFVRAAEWNETNEETGETEHKILFPEEVTQKILDYKRLTLGPYQYACQFLNNPVPDGQMAMDPKGLREFDGSTKIATPLNWCICVDPAGALEAAEGEATTISVFSMDHLGHIRIHDVRRKYLEVNKIIDEIVDCHKLYSIRDIGIEKVALSKWLIQLFEKRIRDDVLHVNLIPITRDPRQSKKLGPNSRQQRCCGYIKEGHVLIEKDLAEKEYVKKEMEQWPNGKNDHFIDTLTDAIEMLKPAFILKKKVDQYRIPPRVLGGRANFQTGYSYRSGGYTE